MQLWQHYNVNNLVVVVSFSFSLFSCNHEDEQKMHLVFEMLKKESEIVLLGAGRFSFAISMLSSLKTNDIPPLTSSDPRTRETLLNYSIHKGFSVVAV